MTNAGTRVRQRDIVLLPFPYTDLVNEKLRPAIIISNDRHNNNHRDVICCPITSNPKHYPDSVEITAQDLEEGYLPYTSMIKSTGVFALDSTEIVKHIGRLKKPKTSIVADHIAKAVEHK